jgi:hypothetical protein
MFRDIVDNFLVGLHGFYVILATIHMVGWACLHKMLRLHPWPCPSSPCVCSFCTMQ